MTQSTGSRNEDPANDLDAVNTRLAEWAARSATGSESLIDRFEAMGYAVRGKSEEEVADVLRHPPTRPARQASAHPGSEGGRSAGDNPA